MSIDHVGVSALAENVFLQTRGKIRGNPGKDLPLIWYYILRDSIAQPESGYVCSSLSYSAAHNVPILFFRDALHYLFTMFSHKLEYIARDLLLESSSLAPSGKGTMIAVTDTSACAVVTC